MIQVKGLKSTYQDGSIHGENIQHRKSFSISITLLTTIMIQVKGLKSTYQDGSIHGENIQDRKSFSISITLLTTIMIQVKGSKSTYQDGCIHVRGQSKQAYCGGGWSTHRGCNCALV